MSFPFVATEIVPITLKPGTDITSLETAKHLKEAFTTLRAQKGNKTIYYGPTLEDPSHFDAVIEWATMDDHIAFTKTEEYGPFLSGLHENFVEKINDLHHVREPYVSAAGKALSAPITEILTMYFPLDVDKADFEARFKVFVDTAFAHSGVVAFAGGWVVEELEYEGTKGPAYAAAIGWTSLEKHREYTQTQYFKDSVPKLAEVTRGKAFHHTKFTKFEG